MSLKITDPCLRCAFYVANESACSRYLVAVSQGSHHFDNARAVRLDPKRCGPDAKLYVARVGLVVVEKPPPCLPPKES